MALPALLAGLLSIAAPVPFRTTADVDDALSLRYNPAGLGLVLSPELRVVAGRRFVASLDPPRDVFNPLAEGNDLGLFTAVPIAGLFTIGSSIQWDSFDTSGAVRETILGLGIPLGMASIGGAWSLRRGQPVFSAGVTIRPTDWFSAAFSSYDLGERVGHRQYDLGLAVRPFGERVLLSSRWRITQDVPLFENDGPALTAAAPDRPDIETRLAVEVVDGLFASVSTDLNLDMTFGLGFAFDRGEISAELARQGRERDRFGSFIGEVSVHTDRRPPLFKPSRIVVLDLHGDLLPMTGLNLLTMKLWVATYGTVPLALEAAAESDEVDGLLLRIGEVNIGWGKAQELRTAIMKIRAAGKRVDCQLLAMRDLEYYLATPCNTISIAPATQLEVNGVAATALFIAEGMEKIGVRAKVVAMGAYKSAPDMFTRMTMSPEQRESLGSIVDETYHTLVSAISEGRGIEPGQVEMLIDRGTITATEAKAMKLVDEVLYPDEVEDWLRRLYGGGASFTDFSGVSRPERPVWAPRPQIALIPVDAQIVAGESRTLPLGFGNEAGSTTLLQALEAARRNDNVKAVVLRIDSPGGDAFASDLIARGVMRLAQEKPVIASFGDVAASGGYYIAAPCRAIFAEPTTITGSIGVFSLGFSFEGFLEKVGANVDVLKRGALADRESPFHDMTPEERAAAEREVEGVYARFLQVVAKGRGLSTTDVHKVAQGRIWTGRDAMGHKLVDALGGLGDALRRAKMEAKIGPDERVEILVLPHDRPPLADAVRSVLAPTPDVAKSVADLVPAPLRPALGALIRGGGANQRNTPMALMPFVVTVD